ncbi:MAG: choice-of-anchor D domain-containing protein [Candidatus Poribacteria bacterium]
MNADGTGLTQLTATSNSAWPSWSPDSSQIAFSSMRNGTDWEIFVMDADGVGQTNISDEPSGNDQYPKWSPDNTQIAFVSDRTELSRLFVMDTSGSDQSTLMAAEENDGIASWSPDGAKLAFYSARDGDNDIYIVDADGANLVNVTDDAEDNQVPVWSPILASASYDVTALDFGVVIQPAAPTATFSITNPGTEPLEVAGVSSDNAMFTVSPSGATTIAAAGGSQVYTVTFTPTRVGWETANISLDHDGGGPKALAAGGIGSASIITPVGDMAHTLIVFESGNRIYTMWSDGTNVTELTDGASRNRMPEFSPDGTKIVFNTNRDATDEEIYVMNWDGTDQRNLTATAGTDLQPRWHPDGTRIAFMSERDGASEIYLMDADGSGQVNLTNNAAKDGWPSWSPDGTQIVFESDRDGTWDIWRMDAPSGGNLSQLTAHANREINPSLSPDGTMLVFISDRDTGAAGANQIWVSNADGSIPSPLTSDNVSGIEDRDPRWSPDSSQIVFASARNGGEQELFTVPANGSVEAVNITGPSVLTHGRTPSWSGYLASPSASPASVHVGVIDVASDGSATVTISNSANGLLIVDDITSDNTQFTVSPKAFTVPEGGSQDVTVTYLPTVVGWETGTLSLVSNDPAGPVTLQPMASGRWRLSCRRATSGAPHSRSRPRATATGKYMPSTSCLGAPEPMNGGLRTTARWIGTPRGSRPHQESCLHRIVRTPRTLVTKTTSTPCCQTGRM